MGIQCCLRINLGIEFLIAIASDAFARGLRFASTLVRLVLP